MAREQRAIEECRRLTEENVEIREKFATQMAAMQELRSQYDELLARETHLRVQVERLSTENTKVREALAAERAANERMQADLTRQLQESRAREVPLPT
jgi:septal ring factor EnvC (AmiA/AmiB activator)